MRGFRGGVGFASLLAGVLSFKIPGMSDFFSARALDVPTPFRKHRPTRKIKRRPARVRNGWTPHYFSVNRWPECREAKRRVRQGAHDNQLNSHKPGAVQPRHIFGKD